MGIFVPSVQRISVGSSDEGDGANGEYQWEVSFGEYRWWSYSGFQGLGQLTIRSILVLLRSNYVLHSSTVVAVLPTTFMQQGLPLNILGVCWAYAGDS